MDNMEIKKEKR